MLQPQAHRRGEPPVAEQHRIGEAAFEKRYAIDLVALADEQVLVVGAGPIGLGVAAIAAASGAQVVVLGSGKRLFGDGTPAARPRRPTWKRSSSSIASS